MKWAPKLTSVTLVDPVIEEHPPVFHVVKNLKVESDLEDTRPLADMINTASDTLITLTFSVFGWGSDERLSGIFKKLTTLSLTGCTVLTPGLLSGFHAPALERIEASLWRSEDVKELLDCRGIPFQNLRAILISWGEADDLIQMFSLLCRLVDRCTSLEVFQTDRFASIQCKRTCAFALSYSLQKTNRSLLQAALKKINQGIRDEPDEATNGLTASLLDMSHIPAFSQT